MASFERQQHLSDFELYLFLLDYYSKNREKVQSMTEPEFWEHIDAILDEVNRIKKALRDAGEI